MNHLGNEENCILCDQGVKGDPLNDTGTRWTLKDEEDKEKNIPWLPLLTKQRNYTGKIF